MNPAADSGKLPKLFFFGGTFDPPHAGHVKIVRYILAHEKNPVVIVMPAAGAPLRSDERLFSYRERFGLLRKAFTDEIAGGRVILSKLEHSQPKPNYTVNTLAALAKLCSVKPTLVIGADQAEKLPSWHRAQELIAGFEFLIFARPGSQARTISSLRARVVEDFAEDISATGIRTMLSAVSPDKRFAMALAGLQHL